MELRLQRHQPVHRHRGPGQDEQDQPGAGQRRRPGPAQHEEGRQHEAARPEQGGAQHEEPWRKVDGPHALRLDSLGPVVEDVHAEQHRQDGRHAQRQEEHGHLGGGCQLLRPLARDQAHHHDQCERTDRDARPELEGREPAGQRLPWRPQDQQECEEAGSGPGDCRPAGIGAEERLSGHRPPRGSARVPRAIGRRRRCPGFPGGPAHRRRSPSGRPAPPGRHRST